MMTTQGCVVGGLVAVGWVLGVCGGVGMRQQMLCVSCGGCDGGDVMRVVM